LSEIRRFCLVVDQRPVEDRVLARHRRVEHLQPAGGEEVVVFDSARGVLDAVGGEPVAGVEIAGAVNDRQAYDGAGDGVALLCGPAQIDCIE